MNPETAAGHPPHACGSPSRQRPYAAGWGPAFVCDELVVPGGWRRRLRPREGLVIWSFRISVRLCSRSRTLRLRRSPRLTRAIARHWVGRRSPPREFRVASSTAVLPPPAGRVGAYAGVANRGVAVSDRGALQEGRAGGPSRPGATPGSMVRSPSIELLQRRVSE